MANGDESISVVAELAYQEPEAALDWLAGAFGFETRLVVRNEAGDLVFSETGYGPHTVVVGPEVPPRILSPRSAGGANTQIVRVRIATDLDEHLSRAKSQGAEILTEPELFFFGDRVYFTLDLEGHTWSFAQRIPGKGGPPPAGWSVKRSSDYRPPG